MVDQHTVCWQQRRGLRLEVQDTRLLRDDTTAGMQGLAAQRLPVLVQLHVCGVCTLSASTHTSMPRLAATAAADVAPSKVLSSTSAQYTHSVVRDLHGIRVGELVGVCVPAAVETETSITCLSAGVTSCPGSGGGWAAA